MQPKITDYAPKRPRRQRTFKDLIPGIFMLGLCAVVPSPVPHATSASALPYAYISPVPPVNTSLLPTLPMVEKQAGASAAEVSDPIPSIGQVDAPVADRSLEPSDPVQIIHEVFGPDAPTALAIAQAESGLNCGIDSPTSDSGLFQIHMPVHLEKFAGRSPYDCRANAEVAKQIYDASGWNPWVVYTNGSWRKYL